MPDTRKHVTIYTDGGAEPNPGPGGYGVVLLYAATRKELVGGYRLTTNNRMEILAAIKGLQALKQPCIVKIFTDSKYLADSMNKGWALTWERKNWKRHRNQIVANADLWAVLITLCQTHEVYFEWLKGHAGDTENERCDALSMQFLQMKNLEIDEDYERMPLSFTPPGPILRQQAYTATSKVTVESQPCRKCGTPVIKRIPRRRERKPDRDYFEYYLFCPSCKTMYMVEAARRTVSDPNPSD